MEFSRRSVLLGSLVLAGPAAALPLFYSVFPETAAGWAKNSSNPVPGKPFGTCFDAADTRRPDLPNVVFLAAGKVDCILRKRRWHKMDGPDCRFAAYRRRAGRQSPDNPPSRRSAPDVVHEPDGNEIVDNFATSPDGKNWSRISSPAAMIADRPWEKVAVMCPEVHWDSDVGLYRMWYSGGEQFEPDAIGYATSTDGVHWTKLPDPIFKADKSLEWESAKVTACSVRRLGQWYYMFYIGFKDEHTAAIGIAKSRNGISSWIRNRDNPIIRHGAVLAWDGAAVYKPVPVIEPDRWLLWYNARRRSTEQIGLASHEGLDLGF